MPPALYRWPSVKWPTMASTLEHRARLLKGKGLTHLHSFRRHIIAVSSTATKGSPIEMHRIVILKFLFCLFCCFYLTRGVCVGALGHYKTSCRASVSIPAATLQRVRWLVLLLLYNHLLCLPKRFQNAPRVFVIPNEIGISRIPVTSKPCRKKSKHTRKLLVHAML